MEMTKILNLLQKKVTPELEALGVVEYPARAELMNMMLFKMAPTVEEVELVSSQLAATVAAYCRRHGIKKVLIGGAPYMISSLEAALMSHGLLPVYQYTHRVCTGFKHINGKEVAIYKFEPNGLVDMYTEQHLNNLFE